jgi:hypothetical protein
MMWKRKLVGPMRQPGASPKTPKFAPLFSKAGSQRQETNNFVKRDMLITACSFEDNVLEKGWLVTILPIGRAVLEWRGLP